MGAFPTFAWMMIGRGQAYFPFLLLAFLTYKVFIPKGPQFRKEESDCEGLECYSQCLWLQLPIHPMRKYWYKFHHMLRACTGAAKLPTIIEYPNLDDMKYAVLPVDIPQDEECNIVTLGIGHDITSERKMRLHFPEWCAFHGADPSAVFNKILYESIGGTFHEVAVGATTTKREARVYGERIYENQEVEHVELSEFLTEHAKVQEVVDVLLIDIEGQEFELMPLLGKSGLLDQKNITVCQYNVEFHWPTAEQAYQFAEYLMSTVNDARFLLLKPSKFWKVARLYALNVEDRICKRRYLGIS